MTNHRDRVNQAGLGVQQLLYISSCPSSAQDRFLRKALTAVGNIDVAGTYEAQVDVSGLASLEVHLKPADQVGVPAVPVIASTYADHSTAKTASTPAAAAMQTGVQKDYAIALAGEEVVIVRFTLGGGESINFTNGLAEANGR
jgi:hypothetical protein